MSAPDNRWQRRSFGAGGLVALAVLFLGVVMLSSLGLRNMRLDLTQNRLYTLSPGTLRILQGLKEPLNLYFYFSRESADKQAPMILPYANRVREFLEEVAARSGGKVRLHVIDPQPFSDDEDRAAGLGLESLSPGGGDPLYFGLAGTNSTDGHGAIPLFQIDHEQFLEYDVAKLIQQLSTQKKPVVGVMSSLSMMGESGEPWPVIAQLEELFTLRPVDPAAQRIDSDVDVLMIVHPKNLPARTLYAIDQFVMRGGRVLLLVDPDSGADTAPAGHASDLEPLLASWGVEYDPKQVIGDVDLGLEVRTGAQSPPTRHIGILGLRRDNLARDDVVTASLDQINLATAGFVAKRAGAATAFEPLLTSSASAAPIPAARFAALEDPATLLDGFHPTGQRYALAARITGSLQSAYPAGPPSGGPPEPGPPAVHLGKSSAAANIVVIADTDLLLDYMWVETHAMMGQRISQAFANNGDLIANVLDNLAGSNALISIRGRASFSRPFERIDAMRRRADERLRTKALELGAELKQTEAKLVELQAKRSDQSSMMLTPEQESELRRFTAERARIRKELRDTQRGLDVEIDRMEGWLKAINIVAMPLLVAIAGAFALAWRRRRRSAADGA